jgi:hypothetical protein
MSTRHERAATAEPLCQPDLPGLPSRRFLQPALVRARMAELRRKLEHRPETPATPTACLRPKNEAGDHD